MRIAILISFSFFFTNIISSNFATAVQDVHNLVETKEYSNVQKDSIYKENIKTVQIHKEGWELSYPIIELNSEEKIILSFDFLSSELQDYYYTIIHCDADWQESDLLPSEYLEGFTENQIYNYNFSFNTLHDYIHYSITIPNENIQPRISGNYVIIVYENYNMDEIILIKRFCIIEPKVSIIAEVKRPLIANYRNSGQEIDFTIDYGSYPIDDVFSELKIKILQNNRWDNPITDLKPLFIRDKMLIFDYNEKNVFSGGNEYRFFDIKSLRYQTEYIRQIELRKPNYHIELYPDIPKPFKVYFFENEINGKYYIDIQEETNDETDADYVYVHFYLPYDAPLTDGNIYVFGALTNWQCNTRNQMKYNYEENSYYLTLLLKQGYYNYEYVYVNHKENKLDNTLIEGSHYETENDYLIYVYHRDIRSRYDKLIGIEIINTLSQNTE